MESDRGHQVMLPSRWKRLVPAAGRRWRLVLGIFLAVTFGVWLCLGLFDPKFESEATLLVLSGRRVDSDASRGAANPLAPEVHVLRSRRLIENVVDEMGAEVMASEPLPPQSVLGRLRYYPRTVFRATIRGLESALAGAGLIERLPDRERAVAELERSLFVIQEDRADVVTIRVRLRDPRLCPDVLDVFIDEYLEAQVDVRRNPAVSEQLESRVLGVEASLAAIRTDREVLFEARTAMDVESELGLVLQRLSETQSKRDANRSERLRLSRQREEMITRVDTLPERVRTDEVLRPNPVRERLEQRVADLLLERQALLSRFQPTAPPVAKVEDEIAGLKALLEREKPTTLDAATMEEHPVRREFTEGIEDLGVLIAGLDAESVELESQVERLEQETRDLHRSREALEHMDRARDLAARSRDAFNVQKWNAEVSRDLENMRVAGVAVLSPPSRPVTPAYPNELLVLAIAMPLALFLGVGVAVVSENFDARVGSEWSLLEAGDFDFLGTYVLPAELARPLLNDGGESDGERGSEKSDND